MGQEQIERCYIAMLPERAEATVVRVMGGKELVRRLYELGFVKGARMNTLVLSSPSLILFEVEDCRMALGKGM